MLYREENLPDECCVWVYNISDNLISFLYSAPGNFFVDAYFLLMTRLSSSISSDVDPDRDAILISMLEVARDNVAAVTSNG